MATLVGKAQITTLTKGGTACLVDFIGLTGHVAGMPNLQSGSVTQEGNVKETMNQAGQVTSFFNSDEHIQQDFEFIPESTTLALSLIAASLPTLLSAVTLSNFPVITIGSFVDVLNSALWLYKGGGKINQVIDGPWTMSVTLHRYVNVTAITNPS